MNRKGFTLIEIMAVIVVLGLLIAIIVPVVNNLLKDSEDTLHDEQIDLVVKASKKYMIENSELLPEGSDYTAVYIDDLINSGVIDNDSVIDPKTKEELDGCVVVNYNENFNQYEYNYRDDCSINITFDPEGGSVDTTSKEVMIGKTFGELPTPTRDGYIFKGWRGKNMFDYNEILLDNSSTVSLTDLNGVDVISWKNGNSANSQKFLQGYFSEGKQYTFSGRIASSQKNYGNIKIKYTDGSDENKNFGNIILEPNVFYEQTFTSRNDKSVDYIRGSWNNSEKMYIDINSFQIEEGATATEFEPYQEFDSNTVVKNGSDYVLHAIWEPNSYTVTFDPEGGSVGTTSKQVTFNSTYGELPTPTREGYRFLGWSGKNMYSNTYAYYNNNDVSFQDNSILFDKSRVEGNRMSWIFLRIYMDGTLVMDDYGVTKTQGKRYSKVLDLNGSYHFNGIGIKMNTNKSDGVLYIKNILDQSKKYTVSFNVDMLDFDHAKAIISNLQLEDGEVATEYEPYQEYSSETVVTKASNHTLHAIWEVAS